MEADKKFFDEIGGFLSSSRERGRATQLSRLIEGYSLTAQSEGKSPNTITVVTSSVRYLEQFLVAQGLSTDVNNIDIQILRRFIVDLQQRPRFANHPLTPCQNEPLSGHTINAYARGLQSFWAWLQREEFISHNPFLKMVIPKPPRKVIPIFSEKQLQDMLAAIDLSASDGCRDLAILEMLVDTGIRSQELRDLRLQDINLENRLMKVRGKGSKERHVPFGAKVQKAIWKYVEMHRPEPANPRYDHVFLTRDGCSIKKNRLRGIVRKYGQRAGIQGVRLSPHTFRHTMCVMFLRNGGDVFTLQRITGHSSLEILRGYINLAQSDIVEIHRRNSPIDNLEFKPGRRFKR
ncbi:MAG: tyrosine-type recombinase/integrase [Deltaproteobacteria bacterium]|nr:tyrosine-type recombinase/integrase [Deltaproteobacteria bacterium]